MLPCVVFCLLMPLHYLVLCGSKKAKKTSSTKQPPPRRTDPAVQQENTKETSQSGPSAKQILGSSNEASQMAAHRRSFNAEETQMLACSTQSECDNLSETNSTQPSATKATQMSVDSTEKSTVKEN